MLRCLTVIDTALLALMNYNAFNDELRRNRPIMYSLNQCELHATRKGNIAVVLVSEGGMRKLDLMVMWVDLLGIRE